MKPFKLLPVALLALVAALPAQAADTYTVDKNHSELTFRVKHMFSKVAGKFNDFSGTINWDKADVTKSTVEIHIKSASIDTGNERRDNHLRTDDFFGAEKCPEITFKSTKVVETAKDQLAVTGDFTMHCITKVITLPVKIGGEGKDPGGAIRAGFESGITLNRKEFNMNWNANLDNGGFMLGDDVEITLGIEAKKDTPAAAAPAK